MHYSLYYQAKIRKHDCWLFVAALRSFEHVAFDRTINVQDNVFEFFVPPIMQEYFVQLITYFQEQEIVSEFVQLPNRLLYEPVIPNTLGTFTQTF